MNSKFHIFIVLPKHFASWGSILLTSREEALIGSLLDLFHYFCCFGVLNCLKSPKAEVVTKSVFLLSRARIHFLIFNIHLIYSMAWNLGKALIDIQKQ